MTRRLAVLAPLVLALAGCPGSSGTGGSTRTVGNAPQITSIDASQQAPGATVTIRGVDFGIHPADNTVMFGGSSATVLEATTAELVCEVPAGLPSGTHQVTVTTTGGTSNGVAFVALGSSNAPSISSLSPRVAHGGDRVVIRGRNLGPNPQVQFGILFTGTVLSASSTRIEVQVPIGAWTEPVTVETPVGTSNGVTLLVTSAAPFPPSAPGSQAGDYLRGSGYTSLLVEIDWVRGHRPRQEAVELLLQRLGERCNKPDGVSYVMDDEIASPGIFSWSHQDLVGVEQQHRDYWSSSGTKTLYVLYVDGTSDGDTGTRIVLGTTYSATSFALFHERLAAQSRSAESRAVVHEAGHILGLVNLGIPMQSPHEDPSRENHDVDQDCVMYRSINARSDQFDGACLADLRAAGGR